MLGEDGVEICARCYLKDKEKVPVEYQGRFLNASGDTVGAVYWCPVCGRELHTDGTELKEKEHWLTATSLA